jgi:hypothetical protein
MDMPMGVEKRVVEILPHCFLGAMMSNVWFAVLEYASNNSGPRWDDEESGGGYSLGDKVERFL